MAMLADVASVLFAERISSKRLLNVSGTLIKCFSSVTLSPLTTSFNRKNPSPICSFVR